MPLNISAVGSVQSFNPGLFNSRGFGHFMVDKFMIEKLMDEEFMVEEFMVEKFMVEEFMVEKLKCIVVENI